MATINIIDLQSSGKINNIPSYPILIKGAFLGDIIPETQIEVTEDEEDYSLSFLLNNRDQVYELIKDITKAIYDDLVYLYTPHENCIKDPTHDDRTKDILGAPCDDETYDISNAIDLLSVLNSIGSED